MVPTVERGEILLISLVPAISESDSNAFSKLDVSRCTTTRASLNLRRQAVGRKNWLFVGNDDGARANALFSSLLASCRMVGVEPWAYLRDVLCLIPCWPAQRLLELAPVEWSATSQHSDVRALLENDPFRNVTEQRA